MKALKWIVIILVISIISSIAVADKVPLGSKIGTFIEAEKVIFVNGQRLQGYLIEGELAICIEDLKYCGFDGIWDPNLRRCTFDYIGISKSDELNVAAKSNIVGNSIVKTDIEIFLAGDRVDAYFTNGYSLVKINDLNNFAKIKDEEVINITMNEETLNKQVKFQDEKLEQIIREKLNQPFGAIYQSPLDDIESITEYNVQNEYIDELMPPISPDEKIESLKGIEYIANLVELELTSTIKPEDKELLKKLQKLKKLKLNIPLQYDLEFLQEFQSLEELELDAVESVKPIGELTNLKKLAIKTAAYDLDPLSNLKNLKELSIDVCNTKNPEIFKFLKDMNSIKKLEVCITTTDLISTKLNTEYLNELNNLEEFGLVLKSNHSSSDGVKDLSFLMGFKDLTKLSISGMRNTLGEIDSIEGIDDFKNLRELKIDPQVYELKDLKMLRSLTHLERVDLSWHSIDDLEPLKNMSNLKELYLLGNKGNLKSLKPLENLKNLRILKLSIPNPYMKPKVGNKLEDIDCLGKLNKLEDIEIVGYKIDNISWIKDLTNLKAVNLSYNNITDISAMKGLNSIEQINLSENHIRNIMPIIHDRLEILEGAGNKIDNITFKQKMSKLKGLDISDNNLKNINGVENILNVRQLGLRGNNIEDIKFLHNMVNLNELAIDSNNIVNIDVLNNLTNLEKLGIGGNKIDDITPVFSLVNLEVMNVDEKNRDEILKDGIIWRKLPKLGRFYVNYGRIYTRARDNIRTR